MTRYLPELLTILTEAQLKNACIKLKQVHPVYVPSHNFKNYLLTYPVAMQVTCTYILYLLDKKDFRTMSTILPSLTSACQSNEGMVFPEGFLHVFIIGLSTKIEQIKENFLCVILKDFFVACASQSEMVLLYLCRLLWAVHQDIKPSLLNEILEEMDPGDMVSMGMRVTKVWN